MQSLCSAVVMPEDSCTPPCNLLPPTPGPRELQLDYSPVTPLLLAQWAKDNVLVPRLSASDPRRARVSAVYLVDPRIIVPPFDPLAACSPDVKAQHATYMWVIPLHYTAWITQRLCYKPCHAATLRQTSMGS